MQQSAIKLHNLFNRATPDRPTDRPTATVPQQYVGCYAINIGRPRGKTWMQRCHTRAICHNEQTFRPGNSNGTEAISEGCRHGARREGICMAGGRRQIRAARTTGRSDRRPRPSQAHSVAPFSTEVVETAFPDSLPPPPPTLTYIVAAAALSPSPNDRIQPLQRVRGREGIVK